MILHRKYNISDSRFNKDIEIRVEYEIYGQSLFINVQAYCNDFYGFAIMTNETIEDMNNIGEEVDNTLLLCDMVELAIKDLIREIELTKQRIKETYNG